MVTTPSDRVQVRQLGQLQSPGTCTLCGSGTCPDGYVDVDVFFEWEGQIYFCMRCAEQIAEVIGCLLPVQAEQLRELVNNTETDNKQLREKIDELNGELDSLYTVLGNASNRGITSIAPSEESQDKHESDAKSADGSVSREPVVTQSVKKRRSHDASQSKSSDTIQI